MDEALELWRTDPATLRDFILDDSAARAKLADCPAVDRIYLLALLGLEDQAMEEGLNLLKDSADRLELLLVLARVLQRRYRWHEASLLQEEALRLATTPVKEAQVRHQLGLRLFDEALYGDAAAEFEWASDLYRISGGIQLAEASRLAMHRARALHLAR